MSSPHCSEPGATARRGHSSNMGVNSEDLISIESKSASADAAPVARRSGTYAGRLCRAGEPQRHRGLESACGEHRERGGISRYDAGRTAADSGIRSCDCACRNLRRRQRDRSPLPDVRRHASCTDRRRIGGVGARGAATCRVLQVLFPNRAPVYSQACAGYLPSSTGTPAHLKGVAVGVDVADKILALRKDDGRSTVVTYTPTGTPGSFVPFPPTPTPAGINVPFVRPFTMTSASQFRAYGPPDLTSARYARDLNESKAVGGAVSAIRTPEQEELARFATENPGIYTPRLIRSFADDSRSVVQNARLQAMMWVAQADVTISCFDSKYYFAVMAPSCGDPGGGPGRQRRDGRRSDLATVRVRRRIIRSIPRRIPVRTVRWARC